MKFPFWFFATALAAAAGLPRAASSNMPEEGGVTFNQHIRPILAENCFQCHGPDSGTREAGLRLDLREAALQGVNGRRTIVPGAPELSQMVRRITAADPADRMPPPDSGKSLKPSEIETLKQWIAEGAPYEPHWAYVPVEAPEPPQAGTEWIRNPIDAFILDGFREAGVEPVREADPHTLIRRLSFDLRGLPPPIEDVEAYERDPSQENYRRLVEKYLASPHYGERMAVYWLDLVRFADTVGYHGDQPSHVYPYRDYVIRAFNENLPFDRFTREQLAGDLLPNPTIDQRVATAYNRLNMVTREGGAQAKEYLAKYASDRVRTTSTVWLGSTVGCAECHDHKFDPFTMKDFYALAAFFADIKEEGVYSGGNEAPFLPLLYLPDADQKAKLTEFERRIEAIDAQTADLQALVTRLREVSVSKEEAMALLAGHRHAAADRVEERYRAWLETTARAVAGKIPNEMPVVTGQSSGGAIDTEAWASTEVGGRFAREQKGSDWVRFAIEPFHPPQRLRNDDSVYAWVYLDPENPPAAVGVEWKTGDWNHRAWWGSETDILPIEAAEKSSRQYLGELPESGEWIRLEVPASKIGINQRMDITGVAFRQLGGRAWWGSAGFLGKARGFPPEVVAAIEKPAAERAAEETGRLLAYYIETNDLWQPVKQKAALRYQQDRFRETLPAVVTTEAVEPRVMRILPRGDWMDDSGEIVEPDVPEFLPRAGLDNKEGRLTRLDLANWLVSPENPLTARTMVNRFWALFFGTGIVSTLDELGNRGEWPRNQELLDWLAAEFVSSGWNVKHIVRLLVTSSTYQLASNAPPKLREIDPDNRLHARQSRRRIDAEFIRDNALAISGLLVADVGGPSAKPYQPEGYYRELNFPRRTYTADTGSNQYRRGLYTHWQRTFLHPSLKAFDAPSREECTAERPYSNTPLQALTLLNDPTYVEAARAFAARILTECNATGDSDRVTWAWNQAVSRKPRPEEANALLDLLAYARDQYQENPGAAEELQTVGQFDAPERIENTELAAWTMVTRTILNLQETFVRY